MGAELYSLLGEATLARAIALLQGASAPWCAQWGVPQASLSWRAWRAWDGAAPGAPASWQALAVDGQQQAWFAWPAAMCSELAALMFGQPAQPATLAANVADSALADLVAQLVTALGLDGHGPQGETLAAGPGATMHRPGSGALLLVLTVGATNLVCLLNGASVATLAMPAAAQAAPLAPYKLSMALARTPVRLPVVVGKVQIALDDVLSLQVGDVVRMNATLDQPVQVCNDIGTPLFAAYLGAHEEQVVLEVAAKAKPLSTQ